MPTHPLIAYQKKHRDNKKARLKSSEQSFLSLKFRRVPRKALIDFTKSFAIMIRAKLRLTQALETSIEQCESEAFKQILKDVKYQVESGCSLADSFEKHSHVFDALYISLVRVGELAGIMDTALFRVAAYQEKSEVLRRRIRQALAYPVVVLSVAGAATVFLLTAIVPTFAEMFADFGAELPAPTRLILGISAAVKNNISLLLLCAVFLAAMITWMRSKPEVRLLIDRYKLTMPLVGKLANRSLTARFCRTLGTLLKSGVSLVEALEMLSGATGNRYLNQEIQVITRRVIEGKSLYGEVEKTGLFPELVIQMITVGEKTAELDQMLIHAAAYYEQEVDAVLEGIGSILEPVLIVLIGLILGGILVALYLPMFDLVNVVG